MSEVGYNKMKGGMFAPSYGGYPLDDGDVMWIVGPGGVIRIDE